MMPPMAKLNIHLIFGAGYGAGHIDEKVWLA
jgi:hypothetical protein